MGAAALGRPSHCAAQVTGVWEDTLLGKGSVAEVLCAAATIADDISPQLSPRRGDGGELGPCSDESDDENLRAAAASGRVGPPAVSVCGGAAAAELSPQSRAAAAVGLLPAQASAQAAGCNFVTLRASVAVFAGKWQYEAVLQSSGVQQLGWCTASAENTADDGVGDSVNSYAYDGSRVRRWNVSSHDYGVQWEEGDVIGCCIDLDGRAVDWYHNGQHLGSAYTGIDTASSAPSGADVLAFSPAVSLSQGESCALNFGAVPFCYPQAGYAPLQLGGAALERCGEEVISGLRAALRAAAAGELPPLAFTGVCTLLLRRGLGHLASHARRLPPSPGPYPMPLVSFVARLWLPLITGALQEPRGAESVRRLAAAAQCALDTETEEALWRCCFSVLSWQSSIALHANVADLPLLLAADAPAPTLPPQQSSSPRYAYLGQRPPAPPASPCGEQRAATTEHAAQPPPPACWRPAPALRTLPALCGVERAAEIWLQSPSLNAELALLLHQKPPAPCALRRLFPRAWWSGVDRFTDQLSRCEPLSASGLKADMQCAATHYAGCCDELRSAAIRALMDLPGGGERVCAFLDDGVSRLRDRAQTRGRGIVAGTAEISRAFFLYLKYLNAQGMLSAPPQLVFPPAEADEPRGAAETDGGRNADQDDEDAQRFGGILSHLRKDDAALRDYLSRIPDPPPGDGEVASHFQRLMLAYVHAVRERIARAVQGVVAKNKAAERLAVLLSDRSDDVAQAGPRVAAEVAQHVRRCAWDHVQLFARGEEGELFALCALIFKVAEHYHGTPVYPWLPAHMLEAAVDIIHSLCRGTCDLAGMLGRAPHVARFLVTHLHDGEIAQPDLRDSVVSALAAVLDGSEARRSRVVDALQSPDAQHQMLSALFRCFQDRQGWVTGALAAVRLGQGLYFGPRKTTHSSQQSLDPGGAPVLEWALTPEEDEEEPPAPGGAAASQHAGRDGVPHSSAFFARMLRQHVARHGPALGDAGTQPDTENDGTVHGFLKEVFNHAGWATSEMAQLLSEQQQGSSQGSLPQFDAAQRRRKCGIIAELARKLLQVLEFTATAAPQLFSPGPQTPGAAVGAYEQRQRTNLRVLAELLLHMLRHYLRGPGAAELERLHAVRRTAARSSRVRLLAPVAGIIVSLLWGWDDPGDSLPPEPAAPPDPACPLLRYLASTQEEWEPELFTGLATLDWAQLRGDGAAPGPDGVRKLAYLQSDDFAAAIADAHTAWQAARVPTRRNSGVSAADDSLCPICVVAETDAVFVPCGHESCTECIQRHLLNSRRCFFCNAQVKSVEQKQ
eukprot:TRINITY_DN4141_c0_g1_i2.p1 TRINITY_DN4141_c0_g1~~TRINITY_DN4141_c0_g1_i2.p1  ORF type:complete len:1299 (+),score=418.45 TRINITY_DN4141_c0_g1_i2:80-3976(+)